MEHARAAATAVHGHAGAAVTAEQKGTSLVGQMIHGQDVKGSKSTQVKGRRWSNGYLGTGRLG